MLVMVALLAGFGVAPRHAQASAYPCTEAGLDNAIATGGGASFSCTAPTTITITGTKTVVKTLTLDGGGLLTISGNHLFRVFTVNIGFIFGVQNLAIVNGNATGSNSAKNGGGFYNEGTLSITNSTLAGNTAGYGGAILNDGTLSITNSTLAGNSVSGSGVGVGGGIFSNNTGNATITNSTLSGNAASVSAGGMYNSGTLRITNSLVVNSVGGDLLGTAPIVNSHNITGPFTFADASPAIPGAHGGLSATLALPFGSPAIDSGVCLPTYTDAVTGTVVTVNTDGRGIARPQGNGCDIGAFESTGFPLAHTGDAQSAAVTTAFAQPLTVTVTANDPGITTSGIAITFTAPAAGASGTFTSNLTSVVVSTNANGVATAPAFTANTVAGSYIATATGGGGTVMFTLTNTAGAAASIIVDSGSGQTATLGSDYPARFIVRVFDAYDNPAPGVTVTFAAPSGTNIPTAILSNSSPTNNSGITGVSALATGRPGTFTVTANVSGVTTPATFSLSNLASPSTLTLTGFSPPTGPITGGTIVTLHGTNLGSVTAVSFGGTGGAITASTATSLTVTAPPHAAGTVDIAVTVGGATATIHGYTYLSTGSIAPQPQPSGHPPAGNVVSSGSGIAPMAQPMRR